MRTLNDLVFTDMIKQENSKKQAYEFAIYHSVAIDYFIKDINRNRALSKLFTTLLFDLLQESDDENDEEKGREI